MKISPEPAAQDVISLLEACSLPFADVAPASPVQFFGVRSGGTLVAVVGLELYPPVGLLRSLAVSQSFRGRGFAHALISFAESFSASQGVGTIFLLTTTAVHFFLALGYLPISRSAAPEAIQTTSQFTSLCPASSAFLSKHIAAEG